MNKVQSLSALVNERPTPSPAIVAQEAVRRFPRWALLLLCAVYVASGWVGREPWKSADIAGFGLLFNWIGTSEWAWVLARVAASCLLGLTLMATWYSTYYLARRDAAQPVPFAFGGEAKPTDYARAIADGALLALIACLGLAQLSHETTPGLLQLTLVSLVFFSIARYRYHPFGSVLNLLICLPILALLLAFTSFDLSLATRPSTWSRAGYMLIWFAWPAWFLAVLALFKWRRHWIRKSPSTHIALPLCIVAVHLLGLFIVHHQDRWFLSALPALSSLAAFALPTLRRNLKSLIDLFTLVFFSGCAVIIWVVWLAMQTGIPPQPAANVLRLAPLFTPSLSITALLIAMVLTAIWLWLVNWRIGRHRPAIWMSLVLPASGAVLCWSLLMTLWLPLLDHARSYRPLMVRIQAVMAAQPNGCVQTLGLSEAKVAAVRFYLDQATAEAHRGKDCDWLIVDSDNLGVLPEFVHQSDWQEQARLRRPTDNDEDWVIFQRRGAP